MKFFPLESIGIEEAKEKQFKMVDAISREFSGSEILSRGDLGVTLEKGKPKTTVKAENAIARFFGAEDAILVRGSGTNAIRYALHSVVQAKEKLLIHKAPMYSTTKDSVKMLKIDTVEADFNNDTSLKEKLKDRNIKACLIQYTRQDPSDSYRMDRVIELIKSNSDAAIVTDDNYAAMKVSNIGVELGADLSAFSTFKLLGPEGIGLVVGKNKYIDKIRQLHYSGGMQVQGFEALEVLRGLVYAPVSLAIQATVVEETMTRLNKGEVEGVKKTYIANAQSKVLLVELEENIAKEVCLKAEKLGAGPYPVGAESKYELTPMFYRISGTFLDVDPELGNRMIRINPMRSGPDTIIRILDKAIKGW